jgi:hypothetical protein
MTLTISSTVEFGQFELVTGCSDFDPGLIEAVLWMDGSDAALRTAPPEGGGFIQFIEV